MDVPEEGGPFRHPSIFPDLGVLVNIDDILRAAEDKARAKAEKLGAKVAKKLEKSTKAESEVQPVVPKLHPKLEELVANAAAKLVAKEKRKLEQKKARNQKVTDQTPESRITFEFIEEVYTKTGILPMQSIYWFYEPREQFPMVNRSLVSNDGKYATPIGALCLLRLQEIRSKHIPVAQQPFVALFDTPSHRWVEGSISSLIGLTPSYIIGFVQGFDGNPPGHPQCSRHFHCGYDDGKAILDRYLALDKLQPLPDDPFRDITDPEKLDELFRVCGYRRAGHSPFQNQSRLDAARKSVKDLRREQMGEFFKG